MRFSLEERAEIREEYSEYFTDLLFMELESSHTKFFTTRDITLGEVLARRADIKEIIGANLEGHIDCFTGDDCEEVIENIDDNVFLDTPIISVTKELDENNNPINPNYALNVAVSCVECEHQKEDEEIFSLSAFLNEIEV